MVARMELHDLFDGLDRIVLFCQKYGRRKSSDGAQVGLARLGLFARAPGFGPGMGPGIF